MTLGEKGTTCRSHLEGGRHQPPQSCRKHPLMASTRDQRRLALVGPHSSDHHELRTDCSTCVKPCLKLLQSVTVGDGVEKDNKSSTKLVFQKHKNTAVINYILANLTSIRSSMHRSRKHPITHDPRVPWKLLEAQVAVAVSSGEQTSCRRTRVDTLKLHCCPITAIKACVARTEDPGYSSASTRMEIAFIGTHVWYIRQQ